MCETAFLIIQISKGIVSAWRSFVKLKAQKKRAPVTSRDSEKLTGSLLLANHEHHIDEVLNDQRILNNKEFHIIHLLPMP